MDYSPSFPMTIDSTLDELPSIKSCIEYNTPGEMVIQMFHKEPSNPGVIIMDQGEILGLISREAFFENTGKRFGVEVVLNRPIHLMLDQCSRKPLILSAREKISRAVHEALRRESTSVYDPIIVEDSNKNYRIIDMFTIFLAENQILLTLHNQHTFTIASGIKLSDEEAVMKFLQFTGLKSLKNPAMLINRNSITCDRCGCKVLYSVPDVVRSHPQIEKGIEISIKMGNKSFILYVRHTCGNEIREIPVYHDSELNLRALRPSRLVETYV